MAESYLSAHVEPAAPAIEIVDEPAEGAAVDAVVVQGEGATRATSAPIGLHRPLTIELLTLNAGARDGGATLVTSAVRSMEEQTESVPRALHYLFDDLQPSRIARPLPSQPGSSVVYHTPALLSNELTVELRFSYNQLDVQAAKRLLDLGADALSLPVFAATTALGGPGGATAGKSLLIAAQQAGRAVLGLIGKLVNSTDDWVSTWTMRFDPATGLSCTKPGFWVFYADNADRRVADVRSSRAGAADPVLLLRPDAYRVDTDDCRLVHTCAPDQEVTEERYALVLVHGSPRPALKSWKAAAVTAALAERFFNSTMDTPTDVVTLLTCYNDAVMAKRYGEEKANGADPARLAALLANIQEDKIRDILRG